MRLGVVFPQIEIAGDAEAVRRFVLAAEELKYDYILAYDHVVKAVHADRVPELEGPYTENDPFHDPFVLFGYAAGITKRIEFTTGVLILPQRQTVLVAQQAADVDILSGGRLRLGVGIGWNYVEYDALGENFRTRGRRADEQIGFLRQLWKEPVVSFEGRFDRIDRAGINPRPKRSIPIWIGGVSEPAFARGANLGDGFIFVAFIKPKTAFKHLESLKRKLHEVGRAEEDFGFDLLAHCAKDPQEAATIASDWRDRGGTHCCISSMGKGFGGNINAHIDYIAETRGLLPV